MRFYQRFFFSAKGCQKIPSTRIFIRKNQSLHYRGKCPAQGFFFESKQFFHHSGKIHTSTIPTPREIWRVQTPPTPQYGAPTHGNFEKNQTLHTTPQSTHTWELWKISKSPYHTTEPTHSGKARKKLKSPAQGIFREKTISPPPPPFPKVVYFVQNYRNIFTRKFLQFWRKIWKSASKIVKIFWGASPPSHHSKKFLA